jgi:hypothetical protein
METSAAQDVRRWGSMSGAGGRAHGGSSIFKSLLNCLNSKSPPDGRRRRVRSIWKGFELRNWFWNFGTVGAEEEKALPRRGMQSSASKLWPGACQVLSFWQHGACFSHATWIPGRWRRDWHSLVLVETGILWCAGGSATNLYCHQVHTAFNNSSISWSFFKIINPFSMSCSKGLHVEQTHNCIRTTCNAHCVHEQDKLGNFTHRLLAVCKLFQPSTVLETVAPRVWLNHNSAQQDKSLLQQVYCMNYPQVAGREALALHSWLHRSKGRSKGQKRYTHLGFYLFFALAPY